MRGRGRKWRLGGAVAVAAGLLAAGCGDRALTLPDGVPAGNGEQPPPAGSLPLPISAAVSGASLIDNGDGTYTSVQTINAASTAPHYVRPYSGGFGVYSGANQDFGWMHEFPIWNTTGLNIISAKLVINAYDVDSNVQRGEFDAIKVDGIQLDPGYLQGTNAAWSVTTFDVPVAAILNDGRINVYLDIDIYRYGWLTTLSSSVLRITYSMGPVNGVPFLPELALTPAGLVGDGADLSVAVTGPDPADPDGDAVTHEYRWFLNTGSGGFLDPEFHGRGTFTTNTVPAAATRVGDTWRVQVTPRDDKGAIGPYAVATFGMVTNLDGTPPVITPVVTGTLGANGWYTSDVGVAWTITDTESTAVPGPGCTPAAVTADTGGATFTCSATSAGGPASASVTVKRDATPPVITPVVTGTLGQDGWYTSDVGITWNFDAGISGPATASGCDLVTLTTDTPGVTYTCAVTDNAGHAATASVTVKRDATGPVVTPTVVGTLGDGGWYTSDVQVTWTLVDTESGVNSSEGCEAAVVAADTPAATFTCSATSAGGVTTGSVTVKRDATPPVITPVVTGTLGRDGWYTSDVGIAWSFDAGISGPATTSGCDPVTLTTDTRGVTYSCAVTDHAGQAATASVTVKRDATGPVVTPTVVGTLGAGGWYTSDVQVTWTLVDAESGVHSSEGCEAAVVASDTQAATFTCSAASAGGVTTESVTVKRDATAPTVTGVAAGTMGDDGWFTSDVTFTFTPADNLSGVAALDGCTPAPLTTDTPGVSYTCTVTDGAGHQASADVTAKRDATAPTVTGAAAGAMGDDGWFTSDVTFTFTPADNLSGVAALDGCTPAPLTTDTPGVTHTCLVTDAAGNQASADVTAKRDATNPVVTWTGNAGSYTVEQQVAITCTPSDNLSGVASTTCADVTGPAYAFPLGPNTFSASARDVAGNAGNASVTFTVEVTTGSLCALSQQWVNKEGVAKAMCQQLAAAQRSLDRNSMTSFAGQVDAYIQHVRAQSGKSVTREHAEILMALASAML